MKCGCRRGSSLQVEHDLAQQHVLERGDGPGAVDGVVALEGFVEVGVGRLPVLLLRRMDDPWGRGGGIEKRQERVINGRVKTLEQQSLNRNCKGRKELAQLKEVK